MGETRHAAKQQDRCEQEVDDKPRHAKFLTNRTAKDNLCLFECDRKVAAQGSICQSIGRAIMILALPAAPIVPMSERSKFVVLQQYHRVLRRRSRSQENLLQITRSR
ncbi:MULTISPECIES: hypothetical protein [unclassified Acidiphilium]|uniref:hypothetical protein n=1 Tax=unclassified Acidiphilium TaxID=2617493 RepID=UPI0025C548A2|nr:MULTISPECIES: hypothetical protein [unclassified Acidiphilium]HQT62050.1 hypothetical protein [Acidiphilium sp.]HQT73047.1 hypothetical protein [Acidiphilium sp.]